MELHKVTEFYTEWFRVYHNIISNFAPLLYSKAMSHNAMIQIERVSMIFHCIELHLPKCNGSWVVSINLKFQLPAMFIFFVSRNIYVTKSCLSADCLSACKCSWSYVHWCKFYVQLRSSNVRHFEMVEATGLKIMVLMSPSMSWPLYEFYKKTTNSFKSW
jgi:hypothetical protein